MLRYVTENPDEKWGIIKAAIYIEQFTKYFHTNIYDDSIPIHKTELDSFLFEIRRIERNPLSTDPKVSKQFLMLEIIRVFQIHFPHKISEAIINHFIDNLDATSITRYHFDVIIKMLKLISKSEKAKTWFESNFINTIIKLYQLAKYSSEFDSIKMLFDDFEYDYDSFLEENDQEVIEYFNTYFENKIYDDIDLDDAIKQSTLEYIKKGEDDKAKALIEKSLLDDYDQELLLSGFNRYDRSFKSKLSIDMDIVFDSFKSINKTEDDKFIDSTFSKSSKPNSEMLAIEDLFQRN